MYKRFYILILCFVYIANVSCKSNRRNIIISVTNPLNISRSNETIEITKEQLNFKQLSDLKIKNLSSKKLEIQQEVDNDGDGIIDVILFQPTIPPNSKVFFELSRKSKNEKIDSLEDICYSRFVPERTDDYAWENDRVAFRVYGPTAQILKEKNDPNGTLSSGVDAWLKKVRYPIINKWYKKTTDGLGSYHTDTGEGLDNFHVGISRGVGGIAFKADNKFYYSKNFTNWRTITTGPIRTSFYLEYEDWDAAGNKIKESKIISLDRGQNFSKFKTSISGVNKISAGLTLHEKDGVISSNNEKGWISYWQPHGASELGTAIIAPKNYFIDFESYETELVDESNAYINLNIINHTIIYYAGFTWKESKQFKSKSEWENYLNTFSECINTPLEVSLKN